MPLLPFSRLAVCRLRIGNRSSRRDLLLNGIEPVAHPIHVLDEEVVPGGSANGEPYQEKNGKPCPAPEANFFAHLLVLFLYRLKWPVEGSTTVTP